MKLSLIAVGALAAVVSFSSCSRKGSSSISSSHKSKTSQTTPKVKSAADIEAERQAAIEAARQAEAKAKEEAAAAAAKSLKAKEEAEAKAKAAAEEAAAKAKAAAEEAAAKAKAAAEEAVLVREEKVTVVESNAEIEDANRYHIIIGSFKQLVNARQQCQDAISKGFLPSIMENEDGMYRVAVVSYAAEKTARRKIAELRKERPEYVGIWLLIEKK